MSYTGTQAISGLGALAYANTGTSGSPTWTIIGEAKEVALSGRKNSLQDATNLQSVQKEFVATIPDPGKYEISGNYVPADVGQRFLETQMLNARPFQMKIQFPLQGAETTTGDVKTFTAIMEEWNWPAAVNPEGLITYKGTIQISGAVTTTYGS